MGDAFIVTIVTKNRVHAQQISSDAIERLDCIQVSIDRCEVEHRDIDTTKQTPFVDDTSDLSVLPFVTHEYKSPVEGACVYYHDGKRCGRFKSDPLHHG